LSPPIPDSAPLWPLGVYFGAVVATAAGMLGLSYVLGGRKPEGHQIPYEGGIVPTAFARLRMSAQFYRIAMFFVIFDLEAAFLYAWAVSAIEVGWAGYVEVLVFVAVLLAALAYLWRLGALDQGKKAGEVPTDRADHLGASVVNLSPRRKSIRLSKKVIASSTDRPEALATKKAVA